MTLNVGKLQTGDERRCHTQFGANNNWNGIVVLTAVKDGQFDYYSCSMDELERKYSLQRRITAS